MEKNITLTDSRRSSAAVLAANMVKLVRRPAEWLCAYYSRVLEREVSMRQTWLLVNAQLAFAASFFPVEAPVLFRVVALALLASALLKCRREL